MRTPRSIWQPSTPSADKIVLAPASSLEDFVRAPVGRYWAGHSFIIWMHRPTLAGVTFFGPTADGDLPALLSLHDFPCNPFFAPSFDFLLDCRTFEGLSAPGLEAARFILTACAATGRFRRFAVVRPEGVAGSIVSGVFHDSVTELFRAAMFTTRARALEWLVPRGGRSERDRLDEALESLSGGSPTLVRLREHLTAEPTRPRLSHTARMLNMSARSLQRLLCEHGTSFRIEANRARVRAAEALMLQTDDKLEVIARQVGCSSLAHFSTAFRRMTGECPSSFRARAARCAAPPPM
jgi:AraC-like DNA-binding protein